MKTRFYTVLLLVLWFAGVGPGSLPTFAQAQPPTSPAANGRFDALLNASADRHRIAIVCEGQPRQTQLSPADAEKLTKAIDTTDGSPDAVLPLVAAAFDYSVTDSPRVKNLYLFQKRYTSPDEIPLVTFEEVQRSLTSINAGLRAFLPGDRYDLLNNLYRSLTPEQKQAARYGIPVASLTPQQQGWLQGFAYTRIFTVLETFTLVSQRILLCSDPEARFRWDRKEGAKYPCYEHPWYGDTAKVVLGLNVYTQAGGATARYAESGGSLTVSELAGDSNDPTTPRTPEKRKPEPARTLEKPLYVWAAQLMPRLAQEGGKVQEIQVDPVVARKPVSVFGDRYVAAQNVAEGLALVYGLQPYYGAEQTALRIVPPVPRTVTDPAEVRAEFFRLLPAPLVRVMGRENRMDRYTYAMRRLREIVEPELEKRGEAGLPFREATPEARDLAAITSLLTYQFIGRLPRTAPACVTNMTEGMIQLFIDDLDREYVTVGYSLSTEGSVLQKKQAVRRQRLQR